MSELTLRVPSIEGLPEYRAALEQGWSPSNVRGADFIREQLDKSAADPAGFVASLDDPGAIGGDVKLPDGTMVARLPGFQRWIWDDSFCGGISLRWPADGGRLPAHVLGHIGYSVVPWKRRRGIATRALGLMMMLARRQGLTQVELTAQVDNIPSQRVILANGGQEIGRLHEPHAYGGHECFLFRIDLD